MNTVDGVQYRFKVSGMNSDNDQDYADDVNADADMKANVGI